MADVLPVEPLACLRLSICCVHSKGRINDHSLATQQKAHSIDETKLHWLLHSAELPNPPSR
ncbi:unnamed protein product, partial [Musa textilis]